MELEEQLLHARQVDMYDTITDQLIVAKMNELSDIAQTRFLEETANQLEDIMKKYEYDKQYTFMS